MIRYLSTQETKGDFAKGIKEERKRKEGGEIVGKQVAIWFSVTTRVDDQRNIKRNKIERLPKGRMRRQIERRCYTTKSIQRFCVAVGARNQDRWGPSVCCTKFSQNSLFVDGIAIPPWWTNNIFVQRRDVDFYSSTRDCVTSPFLQEGVFEHFDLVFAISI